MTDSVIVIPNFIPKQELDRIVELTNTAIVSDGLESGDSKEKYSTIKKDEETGKIYKLTTSMVLEEDEVELFSLVRNSIARIHRKLNTYYEEDFYIEQHFGITVYDEGTSLPLHFDGDDADAEVYGRLTPNGHPHRDISTVLYLNDEFLGGELRFPRVGVSVNPRAGMLVMFPGSKEFSHVVTTVTKGKRFIVPQFWAVKK